MKAKKPSTKKPAKLSTPTKAPGAAGLKPKPKTKQSKHDTPKKLARFLALFIQTGNKSKSARLAKVGLTTINRERKENAEFKKVYDEAYEVGGDIIEGEMFRRAIEGVKKPIFQGGKRVGTVTEYSDQMLGLLARGRMKETYGNNFVVAGDPDAPLQYEDIGRDGAMAEISRIFAGAGLKPPVDTCAGAGSIESAVVSVAGPANDGEGNKG